MKDKPPVRPFLVFTMLFIIALMLKLIELYSPKAPFSIWAEHFSVALIVAAILGITYEYFLYQERIQTLRVLLEESRGKVFEALRAYGVLTPEGIFQMLKDIASQTNQIPTLYIPAREEDREYTFAESIHYFDTLVEVRRKEIIEILQTWITPKNHLNVKFLASDFIGQYQIHELAQELIVQAQTVLHNGRLNDGDRDWVLNYIWAASRCEKPKYKILGDTLCNTADEKIEAWILFVPLQMPSRELGDILDKYLNREAPISKENLIRTVRAAAALHKDQKYDGVELLKKYKKRFCDFTKNEIERIWHNYALATEEIKDIFVDKNVQAFHN